MSYKRILVPVDGSPTSNAGLREAIKLAKERGVNRLVLGSNAELAARSVPAPLLLVRSKNGERRPRARKA